MFNIIKSDFKFRMILLIMVLFGVFHYYMVSNPFVVKSKSINDISENSSLIYNNESVPVLMYHSIGKAKFNPYVVSTDRFNLDMQYLNENGFTTLSTDELYDFMANNKPIPKKSVLITFDDGYEDNYTNAFPILKKYNFKATIFVITSTIDKSKHYLSSAQLKEMQSNGIDIESHTNLHDKLGTYSYDAQIKTLKISKQYIEKTLNKTVKYISYPFGSYNSDTLKAVKDLGYEMAFTTKGKWSNKSNGSLTLNRVFISGFHHSNSFQTRMNHSWYLFEDFYL